MTTTSAKKTHFLLLVEESPSCKRMVEYVATIIGRRRNFHIHFLYLMPRMPAQLLETGGGDTPKQEEEVNAELHRQQQKWTDSKKEAAQPTLNGLTAIMRKAGVSRRSIDIEFSDPSDAPFLDRAIPEFAAERRCHTIVIGHESHSWFREIAGGDLTEHLLRHAKATAIWAVQ